MLIAHRPDRHRDALAESLRQRTPTWVVAKHIRALNICGMPLQLRRELQQLADQPSWMREMPDDFDRVDIADTQLATFRELFPDIECAGVDAGDSAALETLVRLGLEALGAGGLPSAEVALADHRQLKLPAGPAGSRATLRKRLRFLRRFEQKAGRVKDTLRLRHAQMQAKSRLAYLVDADACDDTTLAFCAYLAARANRRSLFQLGAQSRAQDTIVDGLERMLRASESTNWEQVALVKPTRGVIERLEPEARGRLIGVFHTALADAADALGGLYPHLPERMRDDMVMVQGVDSSHWNAYAGALNTMRSAWISAVLAADLGEILDTYCPGKAPRLMASDLVWWHRTSGQELHEDTQMFNRLPRPWDVVAGHKSLSREQILAVARDVRVDAQATGWVGPRAPQERERPAPEPALVHGVVVVDPQLAATLRRCGVFSAKQLRETERLPEALVRATALDGERMVQVVAPAPDPDPES